MTQPAAQLFSTLEIEEFHREGYAIVRGLRNSDTVRDMTSATLQGLGAQATDATSFQVGLNTTNAGVFNGSATASFVSHNGEMTDLALGSTVLSLTAVGPGRAGEKLLAAVP